MGLNDNFGTVCSNILMMSLLPNVQQTYSFIVQDETQRQITFGTTKNFSIAAVLQSRQDHYKNKGKQCDHCNKDGHTIENCHTLKYFYKICGKRGHTEDR